MFAYHLPIDFFYFSNYLLPFYGHFIEQKTTKKLMKKSGDLQRF